MIEDLGLAEPNMHEAVPNMGVDAVWQDLGLDGTGAVIAVLDTGVREIMKDSMIWMMTHLYRRPS